MKNEAAIEMMREEFFMEIVKKKIRMSRQRSQAMSLS